MTVIPEKLELIQKAKTFDELGQAHVDLVLSGRDETAAQMAKNQAFYNASVITRMLELLTAKEVFAKYVPKDEENNALTM